jgi:hypothetical protein
MKRATRKSRPNASLAGGLGGIIATRCVEFAVDRLIRPTLGGAILALRAT